MSLTRADLESGLMLRLWRESGQAQRCMSEAELDASARAVIDRYPGHGDPWVFAYGSLIWNPLLDFSDRRRATLRGFHRRFCLWSKTGRGTPDRPGLVLGLDRGGGCSGVAYRIPREKCEHEFRLLWRREMIAGAYHARWVTVRIGPETHHALAFVIDRNHPNYAGRLAADRLVDTLATASGRLGSSRDYLFQTVDGLRTHGLSDPGLEALRARVSSVPAITSPTARSG